MQPADYPITPSHLADLLDKLPGQDIKDVIRRSGACSVPEAERMCQSIYGVSLEERRAQLRAEYNRSIRHCRMFRDTSLSQPHALPQGFRMRTLSGDDMYNAYTI